MIYISVPHMINKSLPWNYDYKYRIYLIYVSVSHMINKSLPWNYDFKFVVEEISNINDKAQVSF